jgi:hypothetical protein
MIDVGNIEETWYEQNLRLMRFCDVDMIGMELRG